MPETLRTPADDLRAACEQWPNRPALIGPGIHLSFSDLLSRAEALAAGLQDCAPDRQGRIAVCAYNTPFHVISLLAVLLSGRTWVPLNPRLGRDELRRIIHVTRPGVVFCDPDCQDRFDAGGANLLVGMDDVDRLVSEYSGKMAAPVETNPTDVQAIKFTGGSSGAPKGVEQSVLNWRTCIDAMISAFGFDGDERNLLAAPITHGTGTLIVPVLAQGGCHICLPQPSKPDGILGAIENDAVTSVYLPPTVIYMMMAEAGISHRNLSSLRHLIIGGAAMRPQEIERAQTIFNGAVETCYGQTEVPQIVTCMRAQDWQNNKSRLTSCGKAVEPSIIKIQNTSDGSEVPTGESGEILIKGPLVMKGYLDRPELTDETIVDGWLRTGDVGFMDADGFLHIRDRIRDVIVTGGFNVFPTDVEAFLGTHPDVKECVVYGIPDDKWGEAVHAAVELHRGATTDPKTLIAHVKATADSIKAPKHIRIVDELPRSAVGKVLRREAKRLFSQSCVDENLSPDS